MKIPNEIIIGERKYKIKEKWRINWRGSIAGQINYNANQLLIQSDLIEKEKEYVFFH